ncbi:MAG: hypothetical protein EBT15_11955 [Betaproteobacteria bacterium]|nr:hypothetical protein [Betaproteobacteria bacterium]
MPSIPIKGEVAKAVHELATIRDERKALEKREAVLKDLILQHLSAGDTGTVRNIPVVAIKEMKRTGIDTERLEKEMPELFKELQKVTSYTRIDTL